MLVIVVGLVLGIDQTTRLLLMTCCLRFLWRSSLGGKSRKSRCLEELDSRLRLQCIEIPGISKKRFYSKDFNLNEM